MSLMLGIKAHREWRKYQKAGEEASLCDAYERAEKHFLDALKIAQSFKLNDKRKLKSMDSLAMVYRAQALWGGEPSKMDLARSVYRSIVDITAKARGSNHLKVVGHLQMMATMVWPAYSSCAA